MDKATQNHMKEILRCIQYVLLRQERKLKFNLSRSDKVKSKLYATLPMLEIRKLDKKFRIYSLCEQMSFSMAILSTEDNKL